MQTASWQPLPLFPPGRMLAPDPLELLWPPRASHGPAPGHWLGGMGEG
jgi:hypothetical protein